LSGSTRVIAIEEHFWAPEFTAHYSAAQLKRPPAMRRQLEELGEERLKDMDAAGIDVQVLSHAPTGPQRLPREIAVEASRMVNDRLHALVETNPQRFAGFAALPTQEPEAAADELQRTVEDLGFKGALIHGLTDKRFLDDRFFWPIFARAEALDVPVYVHPARPLPGVIEAYYGPYAESHPALVQAAWGFGVETATHAIRLVLSGLFDEYPKLKILIGHLGEGIPFHLTRIDEALARPGNKVSSFGKVFKEHFHVTTSGFFSDTALRCTIEEMGIDQVLFAVDWPFVANKPGVDWLKAAPLSEDERTKIAEGNAMRLLRL
jgi:predicted TIM-barrel fold metal-dependent hydrolase